MPFIFISFIAGMLTVLAPCILPLLPIVLGSSAISGDKSQKLLRQPLVVVGSLAASIIIFSLLLKASTSLLGVPAWVWQVLSGGVIILFGLSLLLPELWAKLINATGLVGKSNALLGRGLKQNGLAGNALMGAALGPIFNSCSPTYALIVASFLPASFFIGLIYLLAYTLGLSLMLFAIALFGQKLTTKLSRLSDPKGWFHKAIAILFLLVGVAILFGFDKKAQTFVLDNGFYDPISRLEERLNIK